MTSARFSPALQAVIDLEKQKLVAIAVWKAAHLLRHPEEAREEAARLEAAANPPAPVKPLPWATVNYLEDRRHRTYTLPRHQNP